MSTRVYIHGQTDDQVEELANELKITKADVIMLAVNNYYLKHGKKLRKLEETQA